MGIARIMRIYRADRNVSRAVQLVWFKVFVTRKIWRNFAMNHLGLIVWFIVLVNRWSIFANFFFVISLGKSSQKLENIIIQTLVFLNSLKEHSKVNFIFQNFSFAFQWFWIILMNS